MAKDYPQPKAVTNSTLGDVKQATTEKGPHLLQGKGTKYNQMKIGSGCLVHDARPGHKQKSNLK